MIKRTTQPSNNKYYIRQVSGGLNGAVQGQPCVSGANVLCNCVGYANGRFNEIINDPDLEGIVKAFPYQLVCNAENFIESAKRQGLSISNVPTLGGIMVWQKGATLSDYDGAGHVEVVEQINNDGSVVCSSSGWDGWAFRLLTRHNTNGNWGQDSPYKFRGCIINPKIGGGTVPTEQPLVIDGLGGGLTVMALQKFLSKFEDGVISGQYKSQQKYRKALTAVENGGGGSATVTALQRWLSIAADGYWGPDTSKSLQKKLVAEGFSVGPDGCDSYFGTDSMKALQRFLNWQIWHIDPPSPTPTPTKGYKFIDVSSHQGSIDWAKVKADGVVGAIIRYADDDLLDNRFDENMKGAKAAGLHVGTYIYSRAKTKAEAEDYAVRLYNASKPYDCDMPLYIDLEQKGCEASADTVAIAFLAKMDKLGCTKRGVYANLNWWNNYLKKTRTDYRSNAFWVAQWESDKCDFTPESDVGLWQYSSKGSVNGISGVVDMDICYIAYWERKESVYDKICNWCKRIADSGEYGYKSFTDDPATQICPICNNQPKKYWGWNCIGFAFASWRHGGGIPCTCNCGVIYNGLGDRYYDMSNLEVLASMQNRIGIKDIQLIRNGNTAIPATMLQKGDLLMFYRGRTYAHMGVYVGDGKIADDANSKDGIGYGRSYAEYNAEMPCLFAIRYTGK